VFELHGIALFGLYIWLETVFIEPWRMFAVDIFVMVSPWGARRHHSTKKLLHYFEQCFVQVSGEDSLLQLDEFKEALKRHLVC
jgi:hypothetical protein